MNGRDKEFTPDHPRGRGLILVVLVLPLIVAAIVAAFMGVRGGGWRVPPFPAFPAASFDAVPCAIAVLGGGALLFGFLLLAAIVWCCCRSKCNVPDPAELLRVALQPVLLALRIIQAALAALVAAVDAIIKTLNAVLEILATIAEALRTPGAMAEEEKARVAGLVDVVKEKLTEVVEKGQEMKTGAETTMDAVRGGFGNRL
jgi:hypothetical protein